MVAEMTDSTNISKVSPCVPYYFLCLSYITVQAYAYMPIAWSSGSTVNFIYYLKCVLGF